MLQIKFSKTEIRTLSYERFQHPSPIVQKRMHTLYLKSQQYTHREIADIIDVHENSVTNFVKMYKEGGLTSLKQLNYVSPAGALLPHASTIKADFQKQSPLSAKESRHRIEQLTGVNRSVRQVISFMKRIGMGFRKMGHIPAKADTEVQRKFVKKTLFPIIKKAKQGKCHLLFMDAAHFVLAPFLCHLWCFVRQFIPAPAGRKRLNVLAAINALDQQLTFLSNSTYIDAQVVAQFLKQIAMEYAGLPVYIILDNARYQHCKYIEELAASLNIHLRFLPPYSPNLNIIERLWKFVKKNTLNGKYYDSFNNFTTAILHYLNDINTNPEINMQLKSLVTLKFQTFKKSQILTA